MTVQEKHVFKRLRTFALLAAVVGFTSLQAEASFTSGSAPPPPPPIPGSSPDNPVMPTIWASASAPNRAVFIFDAPVSGLWFDPIPIYGYSISLFGNIQSVQAAPGFDHLRIVVNGVVLDDDLNSHEVFSFAEGVSDFDILGINPTIDGLSPDLPTAFPLRMTFYGSPSWMLWRGIDAPAVPETGTFALGLLGVVGLGLLMGRRRQAGGQ
jgi:hypothetical protein